MTDLERAQLRLGCFQALTGWSRPRAAGDGESTVDKALGLSHVRVPLNFDEQCEFADRLFAWSTRVADLNRGEFDLVGLARLREGSTY